MSTQLPSKHFSVVALQARLQQIGCSWFGLSESQTFDTQSLFSVQGAPGEPFVWQTPVLSQN